jgi:hypothetical protein
VCLYGARISGSALVLGGLEISANQIRPRRKKVEESEVYRGGCTSFLRLSMGFSGEKNVCMQVAVN